MQPERHSLPHVRQRAWRRQVLATTPGLDPHAGRVAAPDLVPFRRVVVDGFWGTSNPSDLGEVYFRPGLRVPFDVEDPAHPGLTELREMYHLPSIAVGSDDLERMQRLSSWVRGTLRHAVPYEMPVWDGRRILDRGSRGVEDYICLHLAVVLVQCALALGYQARMINLHMAVAGGDPAEVAPGGIQCPEHVVTEIWLPDQERWVMFDPDHDCFYRIGDEPASAWQIHSAVVGLDARELTCVRGPHSVAQEPDGTPIEAGADAWFLDYLPQYYRHVSVLMRNDFLSNPDGPTRVAHPIDAATERILWRGGSDLRLNPLFLGPIRVAAPWTDELTLLDDGEYTTAWASTDDPENEHFVDIEFAAREDIAGVTLYWAELDGVFQTSARVTIEIIADETTEVVAQPADEAPFTTISSSSRGVRGIRLRQGPGEGSPTHPHRLWLTQIEVVRSGAASS